MKAKFNKWYVGAFVFLVLAFIPDPTDLIDAGTPFLELAAAILTAYMGRNKGAQ